MSIPVKPEANSVERVVAVVVSFRPELRILLRLLDSLIGQVATTIIVDNASGPEVMRAISARSERREQLIALTANVGIGDAQNLGIARARELGATQVIFFDHDSCPENGMVAALQAALKRLRQHGRKVASIGPCYLDERRGPVPVFVRARGFALTRISQPEWEDVAAVDHLISSGCLIPMSVIDNVGTMNSEFFIDYVDIEWGLRAMSKGYENFGCFSAHMQHSLGDAPVFVLGKAYPARSPMRHYYTFRNAVLLNRLRYVPRDWKWAHGVRTACRFVFFILFGSPRLEQAKMMTLGLWHGFLGRTGPFVPNHQID